MADDKYVLAQAARFGFDKCPICFKLSICSSVITKCGHRFCLACLLRHKGNKLRYRCPTCKSLCTEYSSTLHIFRNLKIFNCDLCEKKGMPITIFETHILQECEKRIVECKDCYEPIPHNELDDHIRKRTTPCEKCSETFHVGSLHKCKYDKIPCERCGMMYQRNLSENHNNIECLHRTIQCYVCGKEASTQFFLTHHKNCALVQCRYCKKIFTTETIQTHDNSCEESKIICSINHCDHECKLKDYLKHLEDEHKNITCSINQCGRVCISQELFINHIKNDHVDTTIPLID